MVRDEFGVAIGLRGVVRRILNAKTRVEAGYDCADCIFKGWVSL
jgi:hypothetical protein